jgi:hypothetical protein
LFFSVDLFNETTISQEVTHDASVNLDVNMSWAIPADDVGPVSIDEPAVYMLVAGTYTPTVTVTNYGYQDQTFDLNLVIEDGSSFEVYNETITGASVDSLGNVQLVFGDDFIPILAGVYTLTATTINDGDEVSGNDEFITAITAYQHTGYGGPDAYGYSYKDNTAPCGPTFDWIDISTTGYPIHFENNDSAHYFMRGPYPIGFGFEFYGYTYDSMYVNSHGSVHLGIRDIWSGTNDCPLPNDGSPHAPMALVFWDFKEVQYEIGQGVYFQYFDDPGVDYTVVQWNVSNSGQDDTLEFEVIFYADGRLLYQYNNVTEDLPDGQGQEAAIGLEFDVDAELYGLGYLCDDDNPGNRLYDGLAIEWLKDTQLPGSVSGTVTDASTLNPIENVYVEAAGTGISDVTDINGDYELPGLYSCDYGIFFSHPSYVDSTVDGVTVTPDNVTTLDVALQPFIQGYEYMAGDANMLVGQWPPQVIGGDVTYLVNYFRGTNSPCLLGDPAFYCAADVNADCQVIGSDVTRMVTYFRGLAAIAPCPDYESAWPTPEDIPGEAPSGWPNCLTPITSGKMIKGGINNR